MKEIPTATVQDKLSVLFGKLHKYVVENNSMLPTLRDGDVVFVNKKFGKIEVGDIVIAKHPLEIVNEVIKRVERINEHGAYFLVGDNPNDSEDSRHYGAVAKDYIRGKVVARMS